MKFIIRNQAKISNKYLRFAKWKIRKLSSKYGKLIYSEIYVKQIAAKPAMYSATVKLGVPGPDLVISAKSKNLRELWSDLSHKMKRQLQKASSRKNS
jgi:ribosome-associated translation inhibitor RaiA